MVADFIQKYYIDPIIYGTGYNAVNTITYALILILAVFLSYKMLRRAGIKIDHKFFIGVIPFIALGGILRAWEDMLEAQKANIFGWPLNYFTVYDTNGTAKNALLISPLIYISVFFIALGALGLSILAIKSNRISKLTKHNYHKIWFGIGLALCLIVISQMKFTNYIGIGIILAILAGWIALFLAIRKITKTKIFSKENIFLLAGHMLDASATFTAIQFYPYSEQHVVPSFFISIFGPVSMFFLKLPVILAVVYFLDKDLAKETEKRTFLKIAVLILGLAPGMRDLLRLGMGV